ncbi:MAG: succinate--CoA ligase subunit beta [Candidatus Micrarchaeota archaeon]
MKLYEYESKALVAKYGIAIPQGKVFQKVEEVDRAGVVKAQVLAGKRGKAGAIKIVDSIEGAKAAASQMLGKKILEQTVHEVYIEDKVDITAEYFLSIVYDDQQKKPVVVISSEGGIEIEELAKNHPEKLVKFPVDPLDGLQGWKARELCKQAGFTGETMPKVADALTRLYKCFVGCDATIVEINPLCLTADGSVVAAGTAMILDDDALYRHKDFTFKQRSAFDRLPTQRELDAKKIDEGDHRGIAGKYIELDGDIAMMTSGGGGSLTNTDALLVAGGKPANYTEYGGNPPTEKMYKLTKVILSKPGLNGCWIAGGIASNTRVDVTFEGIAQALREIKPAFPIVIRRAGPGEKEGFEIMRKLAKEIGLDLHLYGADTPMTSTAKIMVELANKYKAKKGVATTSKSSAKPAKKVKN